MAVMSHNVTPTQLADIAKNIPKIVIITGDQDELIDHHNSKILHDELPVCIGFPFLLSSSRVEN